MPHDRLAGWVGEALAGMGADGRSVALEPLPVEASTRRFFRVRAGASTFVAMHAPPATEDNPRYVALARWFRAGGLHAPEIHAFDAEQGFLLVEDLGARDFETAYRQGETDAALEAALRAVARLQSLPGGDLPPYTEARFVDELGVFAEWLVENLLGGATPALFDAAARHLVAATREVPHRPLHRDYHCRNLVWRDDRTVGIVDFQDALVGPITYDVASLLRDCYHDFDEATVVKWRRRYLHLAALDIDEDRFARAFDFTALQRQLKAVGIFARLWLRDGRRSHLGDIAPVLRRIAGLARRYAQTAELARWIDAEVLPRATGAAFCGSKLDRARQDAH